MGDYYVLKDGVPVRASFDAFKIFRADIRRSVIRQDMFAGALVSTVFLGLDDSFMSPGEPLLFQTKVFGGPLDQHQDRCGGTVEDALRMHEEMRRKVIAAGENTYLLNGATWLKCMLLVIAIAAVIVLFRVVLGGS